MFVTSALKGNDTRLAPGYNGNNLFFLYLPTCALVYGMKTVCEHGSRQTSQSGLSEVILNQPAEEQSRVEVRTAGRMKMIKRNERSGELRKVENTLAQFGITGETSVPDY